MMNLGHDGLPIALGADQNCPVCFGHGLIEDHTYHYASVLIKCTRCFPRFSVTVTGLDESTNLDDLYYIRPNVEFGILVSASQEKRKRYPSFSWIQKTIDRLKHQCALHICGRQAKQLLFEGFFDDWCKNVSRIQINGEISVGDLQRICARFPSLGIITQHVAGREHLLEVDVGSNHMILIDASGGRGISPSSWPKIETKKRVGFAGGLSCANLTEQLIKIREVAKPDFWIDMESSLRNQNDEFDLNIVKKVIDLAGL